MASRVNQKIFQVFKATAMIATVCVASAMAFSESTLEKIVVVGHSQLVDNVVSLQGDALKIANTADILKWVPGAYLNRNGPLTALPHYRGASGDRINVAVDGMTLFAGGPNVMDAPLSSVPSANVKTMTVSRGIASVSVAQESLGGHIDVSSQRGSFAASNTLQTQLRATTLVNANGGGIHTGLLGVVANKEHKGGIAYSDQDGADHQFGARDADSADNDSPNTLFERNRISAFYGMQGKKAEVNIDASRLQTDNTGTAALPMDIRFIDADTINIETSYLFNDWQLRAMFGAQDIEHEMDNFSLRANANPMAFRSTYATGEHYHSKLMLNVPLTRGHLNLGADYSDASHNADISNPNNAMFALSNFNHIEKTIAGIFVEWIARGDALSWELGLRHNQWRTDAGRVSGPMTVAPLAQQFNTTARERDESTSDIVAKLAYQLSPSVTLSAAWAQKNRAPSYQELYLWAPLQATGGLADGRSYIGNLELENETAQELNIGLDLSHRWISVSAQLFYREVDNYIQGTEQINVDNAMQINMISTMMSGASALQFNNVDAELYGADMSYHGKFFDRGYFRGNVSYVRGKRKYVDDNLYRIAPFNHALTVGMNRGSWDVSMTSELVSKQDEVSRFNGEQQTAGFGLLAVDARWQLSRQVNVVMGVDNLFDKYYQQHLNGYNRVAEADVAVGERLPGMGRNFRIGLSVTF